MFIALQVVCLCMCVLFFLNFIQKLTLENVALANVFCIISRHILIGWFVDMGNSSSCENLFLNFRHSQNFAAGSLWSPKPQINCRWTCHDFALPHGLLRLLQEEKLVCLSLCQLISDTICIIHCSCAGHGAA